MMFFGQYMSDDELATIATSRNASWYERQRASRELKRRRLERELDEARQAQNRRKPAEVQP